MTALEIERADVITGLANPEPQQAVMYRTVNRIVVAVMVSIIGVVLGAGILT